MSYYKSCDHCGEAIEGHPTIRDALLGKMECPHCGEHNHLDDGVREVRIDELLKRVDTLEAKLEKSA
ncbi:MAG: hypothetical protein ABS76_26680 [Pelagibacterium sp. SCN 64-44]|nr:MAG: hypothetical protein ABS76_26680 [Pelagibacterium sp. SCN 64-44]